MSQINREALREVITNKDCAECELDGNCHKGHVSDPNIAVICETKVALDDIDGTPTIEVEPVNGNTSDGYHTFNELYHHRAVLFSVIVKAFPDRAWKSRKHHDGTMYDSMFIVGVETPDGQASYHYDIDPYLDMFDCREVETAPEWDGHTPDQAIERIGKLKPEPVRHGHIIFKHRRKGGFRRYTGVDDFGVEHTITVDERYGADLPYCSECGRDAYTDQMFCRYCGAKMDMEGK